MKIRNTGNITTNDPAKSKRRKPQVDADTPVVVNAKELCIQRFKEWWTVDELSAIISQINPDIIMMFSEDNKDVFNSNRLAEILYDTVGTRFLRNIENDTIKRRLFLDLMLETVIIKGLVRQDAILEKVLPTVHHKRRGSINTIQDVVGLEITNNLGLALASVLGLPPSAAEKEHVESLPDTEVVVPHVPLNPLYDYQFTTGVIVRRMLEGTLMEKGREAKRKMVSIPTGAGKTRMVAETIIEWLNDGKPSKNEQQRNSRFILWIAQSNELCEQAFSTFKTIFEDVGRRGTTLHIHRFWGVGGALPTLGMDDLLDEKGVIVATIQSLFKILDQPSQLNTLGRLTACIIIDEAHHAVASSYSDVLREMGFNWDNKKAELSEWGIILIGLTATPFRGKGTGLDTVKLKRRMGGVYFPTIPYSEEMRRYTPHAVVDCQTVAYTQDPIKILGERSYYRGGFIDQSDYSWTITYAGEQNGSREDAASRSSNNSAASTGVGAGDGDGKGDGKGDGGMDKDEESESHLQWSYNGTKNIIHEFQEPGVYEVALTVKDNDGHINTTMSEVAVERRPKESTMTPSERQKNLYHRLIMRNVLCDVYHKVLQSKMYDLSPQDIKHLANFGDFRKDTLRDIGRDRMRNTMIVREIQKLRRLGRKKILFFGCTVAHSRQIAMLLRVLYGVNVRYVDSKMDLDSRMSAIELFRSGDLEVLCNFDVLTTGFDAPNIDCVFVGRPIKSTLLYTQMIGRGMRGTLSGGTESMLLVDIDDNFQLINNYGNLNIELGWRVFQDYWKEWEEPYEYYETGGPDGSAVHGTGAGAGERAGILEDNQVWDEDEDEDDEEEVLAYTCSSCGVRGTGIPDIQRIFGIEGAEQLLTECLRAQDHSMLPSECVKCRTT